MKKLIFTILALTYIISSSIGQQIEPNVIIAKVKDEYRSYCTDNSINEQSLDQFFTQNNISGTERWFKNTSLKKNSKLKSDISLLYLLDYNGIEIRKAIENLSKSKVFEYVEAKYVNNTFHQPDDPAADSVTGSQPSLRMHKLYDTWDITRGDSNILIAVSDAGTNITHEDLVGSFYRNIGDTIDGVDNDGDNLIDNYLGWDFADNDNNPDQFSGGHGAAVCSVVGAETNNGLGMAGMGYLTKIVPLKCAPDNNPGSITAGYEAIQFAAFKGYDVINLSWGCKDCYTQSGQDIISNAVLDNDLVVIAAAGNYEGDTAFYPASYDNVLSVSSVDTNFEKWVNRTWHYNVDLVTHGVAIYSANAAGGYSNSNGTSFSAPMVSGVAALVKDVFPNYTATQIMEQIRVTTDSIYHLAGNFPYFEKLGSGSMNALEAVTNITTPSIRNLERYSRNGYFPVVGDTNFVTGTFVNYLNPTSNLVVTVTSPSPLVTMIDSVVNLGVMITFDTITNSSIPFSFLLDSSTGILTEIWFRFDYSDGSYKDFQFLPMIVNPDFITIDENLVSTTVNSTGNIGFTAPDNRFGVGFTYGGSNLLYEAGIMLSVEDTMIRVADNIRSTVGFINEDFNKIEMVSEVNPGTFSDYKATCLFTDTISKFSNKIGVVVRANYYTWNGSPNDKFIIAEYEITNVNYDTLKDLHCGIFADWDINDAYDNSANWDHNEGFGYAEYNNSVYGGIKPLWAYYGRYYAIDNNQQISGNPFGLYDGFTDAEKHRSLSAVNEKIEAGSPPTDISHTVSANMGDFAPGQTKIMAFALMAGSSITDLQNSAVAAQNAYGNPVTLQGPSPIAYDTFACLGSSTLIRVAGGTDYLLYYGQDDYLVLDDSLPLSTPIIMDTTTLYVSFPDGDFPGIKTPVLVYPYQPEIDFWIEPDTLFLQDRNYIYVHNTSPVFSSVQWDFGNGFSSSSFNPSASYSSEGTYYITLDIRDSLDCSNVLTLPLVAYDSSYDQINNLLESTIDLSPNPSASEIILSNLPLGNNKIELLSASGKLIKMIESTRKTVIMDIGELSIGSYFVRLNGQSYRIVKE